MAEQLEISANRLEQFTNLMQNDEERKRREMEEMKNYSKVQELEMAKSDLEKKLMNEKEKNRALRFKAGQVFLSALEKEDLLWSMLIGFLRSLQTMTTIWQMMRL